MTRDGNSDDPQLPPELPTITGAPKGASPHAAAAETADLPCEERRPCVYPPCGPCRVDRACFRVLRRLRERTGRFGVL